MGELAGKTAVITGASSGIGEATARALHASGANIVLGARRSDRLAAIEAELGAERVTWKETDVLVRGDVAALAELARTRFGGIDILVNNAGIMPLSVLGNRSIQDWERTVDVNIKGVLYAIDAVVDEMITRGTGDIINIASLASTFAFPTTAVYSGTKAALRNIGDGLRRECGGKLRVITVYPGAVESELSFGMTREVGQQLRKYALGDYAPVPAASVADTILFAIQLPPTVSLNDITIRPTGDLA